MRKKCKNQSDDLSEYKQKLSRIEWELNFLKKDNYKLETENKQKTKRINSLVEDIGKVRN